MQREELRNAESIYINYEAIAEAKRQLADESGFKVFYVTSGSCDEPLSLSWTAWSDPVVKEKSKPVRHWVEKNKHPRRIRR